MQNHGYEFPGITLLGSSVNKPYTTFCRPTVLATAVFRTTGQSYVLAVDPAQGASFPIILREGGVDAPEGN